MIEYDNELKQLKRAVLKKYEEHGSGVRRWLVSRLAEMNIVNLSENDISKIMSDVSHKNDIELWSKIADCFGISNFWSITGITSPNDRRGVYLNHIIKYLADKDGFFDGFTDEQVSEREDVFALAEDYPLRSIPDCNKDVIISEHIKCDYRVENGYVHEYSKEDSCEFRQETNIKHILNISLYHHYYKDYLFHQISITNDGNIVVVDTENLCPHFRNHLNDKGYRVIELDISKKKRKKGFQSFNIFKNIHDDKQVELLCNTVFGNKYDGFGYLDEKVKNISKDLIRLLIRIFSENYPEIYTFENLFYILNRTYWDYQNEEKLFLEEIVSYSGICSDDYRQFEKIMENSRTDILNALYYICCILKKFTYIYINDDFSFEELFVEGSRIALFIDNGEHGIYDFDAPLELFLRLMILENSKTKLFLGQYVNYFVRTFDDYMDEAASRGVNITVNIPNIYCLSRHEKTWHNVLNKFDAIINMGVWKEEDFNIISTKVTKVIDLNNNKEIKTKNVIQVCDDNSCSFFVNNKLYIDGFYNESNVKKKSKAELEREKFNMRFNEPFDSIENNGANNMILSSNYRVSLDTRGIAEHNDKHGINLNTIVMGSSFSNKIDTYIIPNLFQANSSYVVTDPGGEIYRQTRDFFINEGYNIKCLNLEKPDNVANTYNPLSYIQTDKDIESFVNTIMPQKSDPFWAQGERAFLNAVTGYVVYKEKEPTVCRILEVIRLLSDDRTEIQAERQKIENVMGNADENDFISRNYKIFSMVSGSTRKSIIISCGAMLQMFDLSDIFSLTQKDNIELERVGTEKTVLYIILPVSHGAYLPLAHIMCSQLSEILYKQREKNRKNRIHVSFILEDFVNIGFMSEELPMRLATCRKYDISYSLLIQSIHQLVMLYPDLYEAILGNCDIKIYLGGNCDITTSKYLIRMMSQSTNDISLSFDKSKNVLNRIFSRNKTKIYYNRDEFFGDIEREIRSMAADKCLIFISSEKVIQDNIYQSKECLNQDKLK